MISQYSKNKQLTNRCNTSANRNHVLPHGPLAPSTVIAPQSAAAAVTTRIGTSTSTDECVDLIPIAGPTHGGDLARWVGYNNDGQTNWKTHICPGENVDLDWKNIKFLGSIFTTWLHRHEPPKNPKSLLEVHEGTGKCSGEPSDGHCTYYNDGRGCQLGLNLDEMLTGSCKRSCGILLQPRKITLDSFHFPPEGLDVSFILPIIHKKTGVTTQVLFKKPPFHWYSPGFFESGNNQNWSRMMGTGSEGTPWSILYAESKEVRAAKEALRLAKLADLEAWVAAQPGGEGSKREGESDEQAGERIMKLRDAQYAAAQALRKAELVLETALQQQNLDWGCPPGKMAPPSISCKNFRAGECLADPKCYPPPNLETYTNVSVYRPNVGGSDYNITEGIRLGEPVKIGCLEKVAFEYVNWNKYGDAGVKDETRQYTTITTKETEHSSESDWGGSTTANIGWKTRLSPWHSDLTVTGHHNWKNTDLTNDKWTTEVERKYSPFCVYQGSDNLSGTCALTGNPCDISYTEAEGPKFTKKCVSALGNNVCCPSRIPCPPPKPGETLGRCPVQYRFLQDTAHDEGEECIPNTPDDDPKDWACIIQNRCKKNASFVQKLVKTDHNDVITAEVLIPNNDFTHPEMLCTGSSQVPACPMNYCAKNEYDLSCQQCKNNEWLSCDKLPEDQIQACIDGVDHISRKVKDEKGRTMTDNYGKPMYKWPLSCTDECSDPDGLPPGDKPKGASKAWDDACKKNKAYLQKYGKCPGTVPYPWEQTWSARHVAACNDTSCAESSMLHGCTKCHEGCKLTTNVLGRGSCS